MALADYQISYHSLTYGPGTAYKILSVTGLRDLPDVVTTDMPMLLHPGMYSGLDTLGGLTITMQIAIVASTGTAFETALTNLESATPILTTGVGPLAFKLPNLAAAHYEARPRRRVVQLVPSYGKSWAMASLEFFCPDPTRVAGES